MDRTDLRLCRTLLFLPASNPRAIGKARTLDADMIILDLEDGVRGEDKAAAREAAVAATHAGFGDRAVAIRVNPAGTPAYEADIAAVKQSAAHLIVLAKAESQKQVRDTSRLAGRPVAAMVETPRAVIDAPAIATGAAALIAGTNDLAASLALPASADRSGLIYALQRILLAARAAGIPAFDGVHNRLEAGEGLAAECAQGRGWGFDGKSVIHPSQIETVNRLFAPTDAELEAARRLIGAATGGAERHEGAMIEAMHVEQARALIAKARLITSSSSRT